MTDFLKHSFSTQNTSDIAGLDELPFWSAPFGIALLDAVTIKKNIRALDIGFGTGFPLIELAGRLGAGSEVCGVDVWEEAVERAHQKIQQRGLTNVRPILHAAESLPFENDFFDLVISNNGLNNVQDLEKVLSEIHRVSKKGAQLVFTLNLPQTMKEFYEIYEGVLLDFHLQKEILKMKEHIHKKRKPIEEIRSLLRHANFVVERETFSEFSYRFPDGTAMLNYFMIREFFLPAWTEILPEDRVPEIFGEVEKKLNRIAAEKGELKLTVPFACLACTCQRLNL
jgi:arsenite methyltransferase